MSSLCCGDESFSVLRKRTLDIVRCERPRESLGCVNKRSIRPLLEFRLPVSFLFSCQLSGR